MRVTRLNQALLLVASAVAATTVCARAIAAVGSEPAPFESGSSPSPKRPGFVLDASALYVIHGGSSFDGRHGYLIQPDQVTHIPKLSGGFGMRTGIGMFMRYVLPAVSARATLNVDWSRHRAIGYNAGNVAYRRDPSTLVNTSLELRAILDTMRVKPFLALAPGYGWLSLPGAITIVEPNTRNTTWSDITLRGFTFALSGGASYPFTEWLSAEASVGMRLHSYKASSVGSISGIGANTGFFGALGLSLLL